MMQSAHEKTKFLRKTIDIDTDLVNIIQDMADKKTFGSFSKMSYLLLQSAVNEKLRKKKSATKEDHS